MGCLIPGRLPLRFAPSDFPLTYAYDLTFTLLVSRVSTYAHTMTEYREIRDLHARTYTLTDEYLSRSFAIHIYLRTHTHF